MGGMVSIPLLLYWDAGLLIVRPGKFHMEMVIWHNAHWATWGRQEQFDNIFPELYEALLPSSIARAKSMGWDGARSAITNSDKSTHELTCFSWPKMTDVETGVSSPGGINGLLLWQQVSRYASKGGCVLMEAASSHVPGNTGLSSITDT